jgi:outer membrane protein OmpA-like peptidoglycan-associated protein
MRVAASRTPLDQIGAANKRGISMRFATQFTLLALGLACSAPPVAAQVKDLTENQMLCQLDPNNGACGKKRGLIIGGGDIPKTWAPNTLNLAINFEFNSAILQTDANINLKKLCVVLPKLEGQQFLIGGHTDSKGSDAYNQALSERRAKAVRNYLITECHIPAENLTSKGFGKTRPLLPDDPAADANRRVEVLNQKPTPPRRSN